MPQLILASGSPYRRTLLARLGIPFHSQLSGISEAHGAAESAADRALRLAVEKARAVAAVHAHAVVIGSDQVASAGEEVLDKPGDAARCRAQLRLLSGRTAHFYTACAVLGGAPAAQLHVDTTTVMFRTLSGAEIDRYVEHEQPFDCAGGFKVEGLGVALFECIESQDPTALIGLPLIWLAAALRRVGYELP